MVGDFHRSDAEDPLIGPRLFADVPEIRQLARRDRGLQLGPSNLDIWIIGGRLADEFPIEVEHYRDHVLHDAAFVGRAAMPPSSGWPLSIAAPRERP